MPVIATDPAARVTLPASLPSDYPVTGLEPVSPQTRFQSLLYQVANGMVTVSPARQTQAVAIYGQSDAQQRLCRFTMNMLDMENTATIADYNHKLGIAYYGRAGTRKNLPPFTLFTRFNQHLSDAAAGELVKRAKQPAAPIILAWANYLGEHHRRLDPFTYLDTRLTNVASAERLAEVTRFVMKNTSDECDTDATARFLLHLLDEAGCKNARDVVTELEKNLQDTQMLEDMSELFVKHFFRNSSKLGLEFFAKQGAEITFAWADDFAISGKMDLATIRTTPWKNQQRRFDTAEPITNSEIRSVLRKPELFDGKVSMVNLGQETLELASAATPGDWVKLARPRYTR